MFSIRPEEVSDGLNALKSVLNDPAGFSRKPTAPSTTGLGVHSGRMTGFGYEMKNRLPVNRFAYELDGIHGTSTSDIAAHHAP
jgi:hypothetical protein